MKTFYQWIEAMVQQGGQVPPTQSQVGQQTPQEQPQQQQVQSGRSWEKQSTQQRENKVLELPNAILIGVDHGVPINLSKQRLQKVLQLARRGVWYDGPRPSPKDPSVIQFVKQYLPNVKMDSWEPEVVGNNKVKMPALATSFFGGKEADWIEKDVINHQNFDPNQPMFQNLVNTASAWTDPGWMKSVNPKDFQTLIQQTASDPKATEVAQKLGLGNPQQLLQLMQSMPTTKENIQKFYELGHRIGWASYEDQSIPPGYTYLSQQLEAITKHRDDYLADLMTTKGGVFFAGYGHLPLVSSILKNRH